MYNLMCSLIVLMQHLQLNHSCVFIVVSKVGNRVTIQLARLRVMVLECL